MEKRLTFADNTAIVKGRAKSFKRMFPQCVDYTYESYYYSKKTYKHEEDGLNFNYKYAVRVEDLEDLTGAEENKGKIAIDLYLVPLADSMDKDVLGRVKSCCGLGEDDEVYISDIIEYGLGATIMSEIVPNCRYIEGTNVKNKLTAIANLLDMVDSMRGFYLDRQWNQIGTNGWDVLNEMINGKDYIKASLDRLPM